MRASYHLRVYPKFSSPFFLRGFFGGNGTWKGRMRAISAMLSEYCACSSVCSKLPPPWDLSSLNLSTTAPTNRLSTMNTPMRMKTMKKKAAGQLASCFGWAPNGNSASPWACREKSGMVSMAAYMTSSHISRPATSYKLSSALATLSKFIFWLRHSRWEKPTGHFAFGFVKSASSKQPQHSSTTPTPPSLHDQNFPAKNCTPMMANTVKKKSTTKQMLMNTGAHSNSTFTTSRIPGMRWMVRNGRSARAERKVRRAPKPEPEPAEVKNG
mmetsp:Transcript_25761/g.43922  ORF Transcript_25761/g.43922 Transcript_25761/m.43922 type:complete len:269 (+) Transcript_25761:456-1262(+)